MGVILIDIVTSRRANLHNELVRLLGLADQFSLASANETYAVAYRPLRRVDDEQIDVWCADLNVGQALPVLPLSIGDSQVVPVDLEATYMDACVRRRLA